MAVQDRVVVIYSVDYLPVGSAITELNQSHGRQGSCTWDKQHMEASPSSALASPGGLVEALGEVMHTSSRSTASSSQCRPVGAWGRASYGMRVAMLKASEIVHSKAGATIDSTVLATASH